jgi:dihydroneopterin aldolase/D-erythro-7,8-dihydroneopterin triphosphate epimerase
MADSIHIQDLLLRTIVGVNEDERNNRQDVVLNLTLHTDLHAAGQSDDLADTVNYRTVTKQVIEHVEQSEYLLVEKLAEQVAAICLEHRGVSSVDVSIDKPGALRFTRSVSVAISRSRIDG